VKRFLMLLSLACVFSSSALAGDIPSVGVPSPAPSTTTQTTTQTSPGEVPSVGSEEMSDVTLSALLIVLSFLAV
jgi:hypothetical protein